MYEGAVLQQVGNSWLLNVADVGLNSLYVADCKSLAKIAKALGKTNDEKEVMPRTDLFTN